MSHVAAILVFAGVCALWLVIQRAAGDPETDRAGTCGACSRRRPDCPGRGDGSCSQPLDRDDVPTA